MRSSAGGDAPPARLGPAMLQHIYINIASFYISLAEGAHQQEGEGGDREECTGDGQLF